jgi:hypothetical protein
MIVGVISVGVMTVGVLSVGVMTLSRTFQCFSWSLVDVLIRVVLIGNYNKKKSSHTFNSLFVSAIKCLT